MIAVELKALAEIAHSDLYESAATMREIRGSGDRTVLLQGIRLAENIPVETPKFDR